MLTSTRRLRTAVSIYGADADKGDRKRPERELRRVTRRLRAVRDLDVLLKALKTATTEGGGTWLIVPPTSGCHPPIVRRPRSATSG
jgi:hypothetical protein